MSGAVETNGVRIIPRKRKSNVGIPPSFVSEDDGVDVAAAKFSASRTRTKAS